MKKKIKGFIQWTRDELRMGREPKTTAYPVTDLRKQEVRMKTHQEFVKTSDTLSEAAKPKEFTNDSKWDDWEPIFSKYLRCLVGRNGVPLSYVIRDHEAGDPTPHEDFLQMYINMAPLNGDAYVIDNGRVLTLLLKFVKSNDLADGAISAINTENDGRKAFMAVKSRFVGQGIMMTSVTKAERTVEKLYYSGEKYPSMYWQKFETELNRAYAILDKHAQRTVYSDQAKLQKLQTRIQSNELKMTREGVSASLAHIPMQMTYDKAMTINPNINRRGIAQVDTRPQYGGRGRGGQQDQNSNRNNRRGGRGNNNYYQERNHPDQETIILRNGKHIKYHASYRFTHEELNQMTEGQRARMKREREEWRARNGRPPRNSNQDRDAAISELRSQIASLSGEREDRSVPTQVEATEQGSRISQVSIGSSGSSFGGRSRQTRLRQQQQQGNNQN